jgi:MoxR-like ATPase
MLMGVPGLAKTLLTETIAHVTGLGTKRIQCTPDLMPSDIIGTEILETVHDKTDGKKHFRFIEGPVFTNLLMADEINRASPRTQSALLQAMQEGSVSVSGHTYPLPKPFHVLATRNPLEQEGTYPLPEAQLDRFIMQIHMDYPQEQDEIAIITQTTGQARPAPQAVLKHDDILSIQSLIRDMPVGEKLVARAVRMTRMARAETTELAIVKDCVSWAPGPRAGQSLILAAKAHAFLNGRTTPDSSDLEAIAYSVLNHRMALNYNAKAQSITLGGLIDTLVDDSRAAA